MKTKAVIMEELLVQLTMVLLRSPSITAVDKSVLDYLLGQLADADRAATTTETAAA